VKKEQTQQEQLRAARKRLKATTGELAGRLGVSKAAVLSWLAPEKSGKHRTMPQSAKLLLAAILAQHRAKGQK
jgi:DNA-binding transcriptional regulator YiaG